MQTLANYELFTNTDDFGSEHGTEAFKAEYQQQAMNGEPLKTLAELYAAAEFSKPIYEEPIRRIVDQVVCHPDEDEIEFAPLKGTARVQQKQWMIIRIEHQASVKFSTCAKVTKFLELVKNQGLPIVKAKNRFAKPILTGYRDLNICIRIDVVTNHLDQEFYHICELQIHHKAIQHLDKSLQSHDYYEYFRSYFAGATGSLEDRLEDLKAIINSGAVYGSFLNQVLEESNDFGKAWGSVSKYDLGRWHSTKRHKS